MYFYLSTIYLIFDLCNTVFVILHWKTFHHSAFLKYASMLICRLGGDAESIMIPLKSWYLWSSEAHCNILYMRWIIHLKQWVNEDLRTYKKFQNFRGRNSDFIDHFENAFSALNVLHRQEGESISISTFSFRSSVNKEPGGFITSSDQ